MNTKEDRTSHWRSLEVFIIHGVVSASIPLWQICAIIQQRSSFANWDGQALTRCSLGGGGLTFSAIMWTQDSEKG